MVQWTVGTNSTIYSDVNPTMPYLTPRALVDHSQLFTVIGMKNAAKTEEKITIL